MNGPQKMFIAVDLSRFHLDKSFSSSFILYGLLICGEWTKTCVGGLDENNRQNRHPSLDTVSYLEIKEMEG